MIITKIEITEYERVIKEFSALSDTIRKKVFVKVLKNNTRVLENRMKALCPVSRTGMKGTKNRPAHPPGYLRASIGTIVGKGKDFPTIYVKPRFKGKWDPWYEHFPMLGVAGFKETEPHPFVDKAWEEVGGEVKTGLLTDLERQIQFEIDKLK
jgi:hypothetical protein